MLPVRFKLGSHSLYGKRITRSDRGYPSRALMLITKKFGLPELKSDISVAVRLTLNDPNGKLERLPLRVGSTRPYLADNACLANLAARWGCHRDNFVDRQPDRRVNHRPDLADFANYRADLSPLGLISSLLLALHFNCQPRLASPQVRRLFNN